MGFILTNFTVYLFIVSFQCTPVQSLWDPTIKGKCINPQVIMYSAAGIGIFEDLAILALPIRSVLELRLSAWKKFSIIVVFGVGSL